MAHATPPFSAFERMLARRYLAATKSGAGVSLISIIAFGGIMLAVAVLIIVMSVMNGFRTELLDKLLGFNGHIYVRSYDAFDDYAEIRERIAAIPGVTRVTPLVEGYVMASVQGRSAYGQVRGVAPEDLRQIRVVSENIVEGTLDRFGEGRFGGDGVALGARIAGALGLRVGDYVDLLTAQGASTPFGVAPRKKSYRVDAIFSVGVSTFDEVFIFMPLEQAQLYFNRQGRIDQIEVMVAEPDPILPMRRMLAETIGPGVYLIDWTEIHSSFFNALAVERNVMRLILFLIVAIAALNIITGLIMLVKDKTADIAILRSMGATQGAVMRIFLLSGASLGAAGTLAGVALGALFCWRIEEIHNVLSAIFNVTLFNPEVYFLTTIPAEIEWSEVVIVAGWALFASFAATLYPSWRASKLDPVEALRYE
ncbi:MAG: lipoprotein-releasing ABC transporter permease subunit [Parvularculaceae bacterium]